MALILLFQTFFTPISIYALNGQADNVSPTETEEIVEATIITEEDEKAPLYEKADESSKVLILLNNEDEVIILEEYEQFSYVQYIDDESNELKGYVENKYIKKINDVEITENNDQSITKYNQNATQKSITVKTEQEPTQKNENTIHTSSAAINNVEKVFFGVALQEPTFVYKDPVINQNNVWKSYKAGSILKYRSYSDNWYQATVYINGQPRTGYIHKSHVENAVETQETLRGIALKKPTHVYSRASTGASTLKSYAAGTVLKYKTFTNDWYEATVKINNTWKKGYIHKSHVENVDQNQKSLQGLALKSPTHVYSRASTNSASLKSYTSGTILKYKSFSQNWYEATVYLNGQKHTGYIHKSDVDNIVDSKGKTINGYGINHPTNVYALPSTNSKTLKSYDYGQQLKYRTLSENWYEATVYISGKPHKGYIAKNDVIEKLPGLIQGYAQAKETNVYQATSKNSKVLKSYLAGQLLKFRPFNSSWYVATVYLNGKPNIGFIHKNDVGDELRNLAGYAQLEPTNVYESTSKSSKVLKSYRAGHVLLFQPHNDSWYKATVYINGTKKTGYIHKGDVGNSIPTLEGYALLNPTNVYATTSTSSKVLKKYKQGHILKYKPYNNNWYVAKIKVNDKWKNGYIHRNHVGSQIKSLYNISFEQALELQMKANPQTDRYFGWVSKNYIKNNEVIASSLNVREGPGTNYKILDTLKERTKVSIIGESNGWYKIEYGNRSWTKAHIEQVRYYLDPNNFVNDNIQKFQFMDLSKTSGLTVEYLNNYLKGKGILEGKGKDFIEASQKHGVNEVYLVAHAILETDHGRSLLSNGSIEVGEITENTKYFVQINNSNKVDYYVAENIEVVDNKGNTVKKWVISTTSQSTKNSVKNKIKPVYNMFGIGAYDSNPNVLGAVRAYREGWFSPRDAILGGVDFIGGNYVKSGQNTLYKMRWNPQGMVDQGQATHQYATDIAWAYKQVNRIYQIINEIGNSSYFFDIPIYK